MNNALPETGSALACRWMVSGLITELAAFTRFDELAHHMCEQMHELTGASGVVFYHHSDKDSTCRPVSIYPQENAALFDQDRLSGLCLVCRPDPVPFLVEQLKGEDALYEPLMSGGFRSLLRIPIRCADQLSGQFILLDVEDEKLAAEIESALHLLEPTIGLALQHCAARREIKQQKSMLDELVELRTAELQRVNDELADSRLAALNMMEDAILSGEKMAFQNNLFNSFMDSLPSLVLFKDTEGRLLTVNKAFAEWKKDEPENLHGKTAYDFLTQDEAEQVEKDDHYVMETGKTLQKEQFIGGRWWMLIKVPRYDEAGAVAGSYEVIWDITDRKEAEKQLELSRFALDHSSLAIFLADEHGCFHYTNKRASDLLGYSSEEFKAMSVMDVESEQCRSSEGWKASWNYVKEHQRAQFEGVHRRKNGESYPVEVAANYLTWDGGEYMIGFTSDITERKAAREQLEVSEARFRSYIEHAPHAIFITDEVGNYLDVNEAAATMTGYSKDELRGMHVLDLYEDAQVRNRAEEVFHKMLDTGEVQVELPFLAKSGEKRWWSISTAPLPNHHIIGFAQDITQRIEMTAALKKSREQYSTLLSNLPGMAYLCDCDKNWTMRFISSGCLEITGYAPQAIIGSRLVSFAELMHPDDRTRVFEAVQMSLRKKTHFEQEYRIRTQTGQVKWVSERGIGREDSAGNTVIEGFISDITERKQAEEQLRAVSEEQNLILSNSTLGIALVRNRVFEWVNPRLSEILGIPLEDIQNHSTRLFYQSDEDYKKTGMTAYEVLSKNELFDRTVRFNQVQGHSFWGRLTGKALDAGNPDAGSIWMLEDITERRESEKELLRLSTAIEQSPDAIVITDVEGIIQYVNPAFESNTGYVRSEVVGTNPRILKSGEHRDRTYETLWKTVSSGRKWDGRLINRKKDGSLITAEVSIAPVKDDTGRIINYVAIQRDITADLAREEELRQSQKMEAIGLLAGGVAHDFNNILQAIQGFCELLLYDLDPGSQQYQNALEIKQSAGKAVGLTKQLLAFGRKQPLETRLLDVQAVLQENEGLLQILLGEHYALQMDCKPGVSRIRMDAGQLIQVIMNLAVNARDAMPEGGCFSVTAEEVVLKQQETGMPGSRPGRFARLSFSDTGSGIDPGILPRLFEPFFTTKDVGKGTGLGLSVVYGIMQQNNGWVNVTSEKGHGTTFTLYFPSAESCASDAPNGAELRESEFIRILVVEDDLLLQPLFREILEAAEFSVYMAGSVEEALTTFRSLEKRIDLLLTDMQLPDGYGIDLADRLRKDLPHLPVLLCSGYPEEEQRWEKLEQSSYIFLHKPFTAVGLMNSIQKALIKIEQEKRDGENYRY
ncbi:PAS domain S-box protein [Pontiella agarivorans]|uniref:histidine kinase n=1 Tax=Pontiella agarivorans TaxID=3038953 RepID=A0ABU5MX13_9BACT|nr:PAS domain S-box protein [Pontiella agarivorans]MDZ8118724.1 PAS domain S-box protein [Pontiella agarivorans]